MKDFLKMTLAVIIGLVAVTILSTFIAVGMLGSLALSGKHPVTQMPHNAMLCIDASKVTVQEQRMELDPMASLQGNEMAILGLRDAVSAIGKAAEDPAIEGIYLKPDASTMSLATLQEIRTALNNFRRSGKPVVAYVEAVSTGSYFIASVADKVYMTSQPGASTMLSGISSQMIFLKDLLDRLGVNVQLIRHGKYKSAGEMFVRSGASDENLEQYRAMIGSIWETVASQIAESRSITVADLNGAIDGLKLCVPQDFVDEGLVDELLTRQQLEEKLTAISGGRRNFIGIEDYINLKIPAFSKARKEIAVIYANGEIIDGNEDTEVAGDRFARIISDVRADSTVKAVVLRVNSPGGSVLASAKIKNELDLLRNEKPLIASYGDYAASGGYWISAACDKIFTNAVTLTGSIGVFGMIPDFSKTAKNLAHVNITSVSSNAHGDMYSLMRPLDKDEYAYMQRSIEDIYGRFVGLVSDARGLDSTYVDSIAQGRVWSGTDAMSRGLVDEFGTLEDAIAYAASIAGDENPDNWKVGEYPQPLTAMEQLLTMFGEKMEEEEFIFSGTAFESTARTLKECSRNWKDRETVYARIPCDIRIN